MADKRPAVGIEASNGGGQAKDYGQLQIRLGCAGCSESVNCQSDKTPGEVFSEIADSIPYEVRGDGAMWTRSGNIACRDAVKCPNRENIESAAESFGVRQSLTELAEIN